MKNPHEQSEFVKADEVEQAPPPENNRDETPKTQKVQKYSGAYYYVDMDDNRLAWMSFAKTTLTIAAFILQIVILLLPASDKGGAMYVSKHVASYGLLYAVFTVFGMFCVSVWLLVMNQIRYKIQKRITAEHAPKSGFKNRAYFGQELYMAVLAVMSVFYLSFVCIRFDGWGLGAFFISLASLAAAVAARQITHITLRNAELIKNSEFGIRNAE